MLVSPRLAGLTVAALAAAISSSTHADDRSALNACQAVIDRAAQAALNKSATSARPDDAEIQRCQIVIREWTLRDSRMLVDEQGRPQR